MLPYLGRCIASVQDQQVAAEHIIIDGISKDGTIDYLNGIDQVKKIIGKDKGMYDAINKGFLEAKGEVIGHLNCDEQYLEGTLQKVKQIFDAHPEVDIVYGNMLTVFPDGRFNSFKKSLPFRTHYVLASILYVATCTVFYRKRIIEKGFLFDINYKSCGDVEYLIRLKQHHFKFYHLPEYFSTFTITGNNLSQNPISAAENNKIIAQYAKIKQPFLGIYKLLKAAEKTIRGGYSQKFPLTYHIYTEDSLQQRKAFIVEKGSHKTTWN
jgi:glycosyltransferase involved in cell wall biosynthesis